MFNSKEKLSSQKKIFQVKEKILEAKNSDKREKREDSKTIFIHRII